MVLRLTAPPSRRATALAISLLGVVAAAGCSSNDSGGLPAFTPGVGTGAVTSPPVSSGTSSGATTSGAAPDPGTASPTLEGAALVSVGLAPPPAKDSAAVFRGYVEFWQADMAALTRSDPAWKPLLDRLSGQQRLDTVGVLEANRTKKQKITGTIVIRPQVLAVRGSVASVRDCVDLSRTRAVDASGATVAGTTGKAGVAYAATLTLKGAVWTVSNIDGVTDPTCS